MFSAAYIQKLRDREKGKVQRTEKFSMGLGLCVSNMQPESLIKQKLSTLSSLK